MTIFKPLYDSENGRADKDANSEAQDNRHDGVIGVLQYVALRVERHGAVEDVLHGEPERDCGNQTADDGKEELSRSGAAAVLIDALADPRNTIVDGTPGFGVVVIAATNYFVRFAIHVAFAVTTGFNHHSTGGIAVVTEGSLNVTGSLSRRSAGRIGFLTNHAFGVAGEFSVQSTGRIGLAADKPSGFIALTARFRNGMGRSLSRSGLRFAEETIDVITHFDHLYPT